jgi:hypothetical protein
MMLLILVYHFPMRVHPAPASTIPRIAKACLPIRLPRVGNKQESFGFLAGAPVTKPHYLLL